MKNAVKTNVVVNLIRTLTMMVLSFITFPCVCRYLGDTMMGLYSWATAFVYYFLILARISIPNIAVRECIKVRDNKEELAHKVQEFFILQAITTLLSFGLMCAVVFSVGIPDFTDPLHRSLIFILSLNFLTGVLSFEWLFTALEKHIYMAVRSSTDLNLIKSRPNFYFHHHTLRLRLELGFLEGKKKNLRDSIFSCLDRNKNQ